MSEGIGLVLVGVLALISLVALFLVVSVLFPGVVNRCRESIDDRYKRSFWLGFVNTLVVALLVAGFAALGERVAQLFFLLAVVLLVFYVPSALFGLIALGKLIGERLFGQQSSIRQQIYGSAVMVLASLFPFLGWYVLFPFLLILGFGAYLDGVLPKKLPQQEKVTD